MIDELLSIFPGLREMLSLHSPIYLVGGAIRDQLLQREVHDLDFVTQFDARSLARKVANQLHGAFFVLDAERAIYRVILTTESKKQFHLDFARFQAENLEQDLLKRDFSINAVAISIEETPQIFDPCHGIDDIRKKILRLCSVTSLRDDPLRIMRAVRFAVQFGFRMEPELISSLRQEVQNLSKVAHERIRDELFFLLEDTHIRTSISLLDRLGILSQLMPQVNELKSLAQGSPHIYSVWEHTLVLLDELQGLLNVLAGKTLEDGAQNLKFASASLKLGRYRTQMEEHFLQELVPGRSRYALLFLAALFHDMGKMDTLTHDNQGQIHFYQHEKFSAERWSEFGKWLALSQSEIAWGNTLLQNHMRIHNLVKQENPLSKRAVFRYFRDCGDLGIDLCLLSLADFLATYGIEYPENTWEKYLDACRRLMEAWWDEKKEIVQPEKLLSGDDIQKIFHLSPSPLIGKILNDLWEQQAIGEVATREQAIQWVTTWLKSNTPQ